MKECRFLFGKPLPVDSRLSVYHPQPVTATRYPPWNYGFTKTGMLRKWSFPFGACRPLERLLLVLRRVTLIPSWELRYTTLAKGNCIFKIDFSGEKYMLVPRRVTQSFTHWAIIRNIINNLEAVARPSWMLGYSRIGGDLHWLKKGIFQVMLLTAKRRMSERHCDGIAQVNSYWIPFGSRIKMHTAAAIINHWSSNPIGLDHFEAWHVTAKSKSTDNQKGSDWIRYNSVELTWHLGDEGFLRQPRHTSASGEWMAIQLPVHVHTHVGAWICCLDAP